MSNKAINEAIIAKVKADKHELDSAHDLLINILDHFDIDPDTYLNPAVVDAFFATLQDDEMAEIYRWGMGDTCVRDSIYVRFTETMDTMPESIMQVYRQHHS